MLTRHICSLAAALLLCAMLPLSAVEPEEPDAPRASTLVVKQELQTVINGQLAAFRADDYATAYTFAAAGIRDQFPVARFEEMVRNAYPPIARSDSARFGIAFDNGVQAVVNVSVRGKDAETSTEYQYTLAKEDEGWKITGVTEIEPTTVEA